MRALGEPIRQVFLDEFLDRGELSPAALVRVLEDDFDLTPKYVSYHVRALEDVGIVRLVRTRSVRGATEHFYAVTPRGRALGEMMRTLRERED